MRAYLVVRYWGLFWLGLATFLQLLQKGANPGYGEHNQDQQNALIFAKKTYGKK